MYEELPQTLLVDFALDMGRKGFLMLRLPPKDEVFAAFEVANNKIENMLHAPNGNLLGKGEDEIIALYLDDFFVSLFEINNHRYYKIQKARILDFFQENNNVYIQMGESYLAFENKLYYPCLCSLMTFVEKLLADSKNPQSTNYKRLLQEKLCALDKICSNDNDTVILKSSLTGFLEFLSKSSNFAEDEPSSINRHWLLHGRVNRKIEKIDCLKLFAVIDSIIEVNEKLR